MSTLFSGRRPVGLPKPPADKQEQTNEPTKIEKRLHQIHTASKLLENRKHQMLIAQCSELLDFTPEQKETYLTPLVNAFAEFVQNLPETRNSYFSSPGGFIDHALMRTASALSMCRAYFIAEAPDKNSANLRGSEVLWMYALFAASIFNGIGKVFSDLIIELHDEDGKHLDRWSPFEGNMLQTKAHKYDYDFEEARQIDLFSRRLSVILAKQLIPFKGFAWISSDKEVLSLWLALLEDNQKDAGTLGPFLVRADALAINTYFDEKRLQHEYSALDPDAKDQIDLIAQEKDEAMLAALAERERLAKLDKSFFKAALPTHEADKRLSEKRNVNTQAGIEFLKWLTNQFKDQKIEFNKTVFHLPTGAIFLPTAMFEAFKQKHQYYRSTQDIIASFNKLQLQAKSDQGGDLHSFIKQEFSATTNKVESKKMDGIVLSNPQIVLPQMVIVAQQNGQSQEVKSSELQHYTHMLTPLIPVSDASKHAVTPEGLNQDAQVKNFSMFGR